MGQLRYQASSFCDVVLFGSVQQREGTKLGLLCYVLQKDHGRNLGGKAKGKVCTAIMYENIQNYETEINILLLQCILYDKCEVEI